MTPARLRGSSCTTRLLWFHKVTDIWWDRHKLHQKQLSSRNQRLCSIVRCETEKHCLLLLGLRAVSHTHMFNIYIQKTCKYESQSKHWVQHGNPIKIWCCHVAFANGDTFLGELSNLGDHMTWPFICNGYCYTKYQGKERAKHIHPTTI